ncbi:hypothetical protein HMPREF9120_01743 [Neisseria sp. oral taxon 020 str. F0370]|jgi:hypothetical protein|uniref:hypothetical protein n=1 Tax=unclassified Neisseria TaxID=2623750 RepID=UPI0002A3F4B8|nr:MULTISPECIES: hypothetical protein [unclassified Neisseria]ASP17115.1 hypothetical protein CGZ77_04760 [Neisseria sp. KEM232]EKY05677.1 hypothetical protein HMPREF9120_01743 [Neisseria sp. oral taxon 020 str. F0370]
MINKKLEFKVLVMDLDILEKAVEMYNLDPTSNVKFQIINEIEDSLNSATIQSDKYNIEEVFRLGYRLADLENYLQNKGEFDW